MIYTLGEILLDVIIQPDGTSAAVPGGSMLNASVTMVRKGADVALISELGKDLTGDFILRFLKTNGINTHFIHRYGRNQTSLALAFLDEQAKPNYSFYKTYPENRILNLPGRFTNSDILAMASFYSIDPAIRSQVRKLIQTAKQYQTTLFYDPNIRHKRHLKNIEITQAVEENLAFADIIKGSDEDFTNIFGKDTPEDWYRKIRQINPEAPVIITLGENGSMAFVNGKTIKQKAVKTKVVSTVGAGDAFDAGIISSLSKLNKPLSQIRHDEWKTILESASQLASVVCGSTKNYIPAEKL